MNRCQPGGSRGSNADDAGLSLIELLLAGALTAIVGAMALLWLFSVNRTATDFTAEQQAENDLRFILDRAVAEFADARPPASCADDPLYLVERLWRGSVGAGCSPRRVGL